MHLLFFQISYNRSEKLKIIFEVIVLFEKNANSKNIKYSCPIS